MSLPALIDMVNFIIRVACPWIRWNDLPKCSLQESTCHNHTFCVGAWNMQRDANSWLCPVYILGIGAAFCLMYPLTHISFTKIERFIHCFLDIFMDMWDEYISMSQNLITQHW